VKKTENSVMPFEFGKCPRPKGLPVATRAAWNRLEAELLEARKLAQSDTELMLALLQARADIYRGSGERKAAARKEAARLEKIWADRPPFPLPADKPAEAGEEKSTISLEAFIATVAQCRGTFEQRVVPGQALTLDKDGVPYTWQELDAATVARTYCQDIIAGSIVAGELTVRMAARGLDDLDHAHERGFVFDVWEARLIVQWFESFCGIKLEPWEQFIISSIFSWKDAAGFRRFKQAWLSVARKNGKTAIAAGIGLFGLVADQTKFAEVYASATKKDQARLTYRDAVRMCEAHPQLKEYVKQWSGSLEVESEDSIFQPLSADVRSSDGTRPSVVLADEIHEWGDRTQFDKLISGMVLRKNRLIVCTTTAGDNLDSFCAGKEEFCEKILTGIAPDDAQFVAIYRMSPQDDYRNPALWKKSNPNLGVSALPDALAGQLTEIENDPSSLNGFLRFACNQWVTLRAGCTFPMDRIDTCRGAEFKDMTPMAIRKWFIANHRGLQPAGTAPKAYGGFDYGEVSDMACFVLLFPDILLPGQKVRKHIALPWFFMPEANLLAKEKLWRVPITTWAREGWVTLLRGDLADPAAIAPHIEKVCAAFPVLGCAFDRWGGIRAMMADFTQRRVMATQELPQHAGFLSAPCKEFKMAFLKSEFAHLDNPVARWHLSNVELESDERTSGMVPRKANDDAHKKIDFVSGIINAWYLSNDKDFKPLFGSLKISMV
jgi:phage terminase large subunit-like protein